MDLYKTAADLVCLKQKIGLGDTVLDSLLEGGFSTREICEISGAFDYACVILGRSKSINSKSVGESSSGKTQICLQLLVHSVVFEKSCSSKAVYFHTEGDAPLDRLREIAETYIDRYGHGIDEG
jgi:RecA/RadA recombinase